MKVGFAATAERDLEEIGDFIAKDNVERAITFVAELHRSAQELAEWPRRFPLVHPMRDIRKRTHGNYLILYRIEDARIVVLRVVHGTRDLGPLLLPDA